ncbi:MAG: enoyl-CoA hydratase/isomerase family protein [Chloroflexi bacterium]|nr:enoyl-CoA hydratase/isomerase family protein [Chloroflexota bacterium]
MDAESLQLERQGAVATIVLNRPQVLNAFDPPMREEFGRLLEELMADQGVRALVIRGAGSSFCAGDDMRTVGSSSPGAPRRLGGHPGPDWLQRLWEWQAPTIAAIHGYAVGFGFDLALYCDFRVVAQDAKLGDLRAPRALHMGTGGTVLLPHLVGLSRAMEVLLLGELFDGQTASQIGLAHRVIPSEEVVATAMALAERLANGPTRRYGIIKRQAYGALGLRLAEALAYEQSFRGEVVEDMEEGRRAFVEKRSPRFTGR